MQMDNAKLFKYVTQIKDKKHESNVMDWMRWNQLMENKYVEGGIFWNEIACQKNEKEEMFLNGRTFIQSRWMVLIKLP